MKTTTCKSFESILNSIYEESITSKSALKANPALYADFWLAAKDFCHYALLSKTNGKNNDGHILPGNSYKIDRLVELGETTREDIESDCMVKIIEKLDLVLKQPLKKQYNYCYTICNNLVNDRFRALPPSNYTTTSLNETIKSGTVPSDDACTYEDIIGDVTYNAERIFFVKENVKELKTANSNQILKEIAILSKRPAELLVRLACEHLRIKPGALASMITEEGLNDTFFKIIDAIAEDESNSLTQLELLDAIANKMVTEESLKADTHDQSTISKQISRLIYRANNRLNK